MRIVSLVPSATEMLFALGLGDDLIAVTHECDYPLEALALPRVTRAILPDDLSSAEIDAVVKERALAGESIYKLDADLLYELQPDLIVTQRLCAVCAISEDDVRALAEELESQPIVISLDPHTLGEIIGDYRTLAQVTDTKDEAVELIKEISERIDRVRVGVRKAERPRVVALEWLDPPYVAGHWIPQLVEYAGGEDVLGFAGEPSEEIGWEAVAALEPEIVIVMPCGFDAEIAHRESEMHRDRLASLGASRVVAVDGSAYFSRPGPRVIDGLELLAELIHPELFPENAEHAAKAIPVEL